MTEAFGHVILTRFSVTFEVAQAPADEDWLAYRWGFFRDAAASSLRNQSVRDFTWLVFFDERSPAWLREEVAELSPGLFTPVWLEEPWSHRVVSGAVSAVATRPFLITTRLDSDDGLATRFVEDVHSRFAEQDGLYINFLRGVQVDRSGQVYRYDEPSGPFISYIEKMVPGLPPRTVFQHPGHGRSNFMGPLLEVTGPPRWLQVIHGGNLMNSLRGLRGWPSAANREFSLDLPYRRQVGVFTFAGEWVVSGVRRVRLWMRQPGLAREWARAMRIRLAGERVWPQRVK